MTIESPSASTCPGCGSDVAPALLACPACQRLVHGDRLRELAQTAGAAPDVLTALVAWREALDLLPPQSRQHATVTAKVQELSRQIDSDPAARAAAKKQEKSKPRAAAGFGAFGAIVLFLITKGKLLLMGLTQSSTLLSMLLSIGVYWSVWGWKFAVGLVVSIYIHEMGHVAMLHRYGFKASAPTFIPGLGALIRLRQHPVDPREDARIGLAGPIWGLGAALAGVAIWAATREPFFLAIAKVGAWINLFNLVPIASLDGGRGFRAFSRQQQWLATAALATAWYFSHEPLLGILTIVAVLRAATTQGDEKGDVRAAIEYCALVAALSALCKLPVTVP